MLGTGRFANASCFAALALFAGGCSKSGDKPDRNFDASVARPAFESNGPRVLFDEAHHNAHHAGRSYRAFVKLIEADGFEVRRGSRRITKQEIERYAVFVVAAAAGDNDTNDEPAFEDSECDVIRDWVSAGGALLLITDHYPFGHAAERLAQRFDVRMSKGVVEDSTHFDPSFEPTHLVYSRTDGGWSDHPILEGRDASERIERVITFTGQAISSDPPAVALLPLSDAARARPPQPAVERRGGDVIVRVAYGDPVAVPGWTQGLALEFGAGRVVVLGDAAMLTAQLHRYDGRPIGTNVAGYDNRQLALNIMRWLARAI